MTMYTSKEKGMIAKEIKRVIFILFFIFFIVYIETYHLGNPFKKLPLYYLLNI
jgi:hypothetical protein